MTESPASSAYVFHIAGYCFEGVNGAICHVYYLDVFTSLVESTGVFERDTDPSGLQGGRGDGSGDRATFVDDYVECNFSGGAVRESLFTYRYLTVSYLPRMVAGLQLAVQRAERSSSY